MQAGTRHTSAWGFRRISAPTAEHRVRILVAVVGLDVQKLADCSRLHRALERLHRRPPSAVMSHSKHDVRTPAGIDHPGSVGRLERKWLFAEYRLAGARCGDDLIEVQGMWRCQNDRDRKSTRLNSSHSQISYAVFCLKKKKNYINLTRPHVNVNIELGTATCRHVVTHLNNYVFVYQVDGSCHGESDGSCTRSI